MQVYAGIIRGVKWLSLCGARMVFDGCVSALKWATLNFQQVSAAAGWRQTGKHVCVSSVLNGLERGLAERED
ncbi:hypothetical protein CgunFtcFv8_014936 [Champsocephalus gunnari]|uniref:Uncharacterized protein n=1 Tax=Champsocephalus gunnari TaxID=52237 RepID=A0AAN8E3P7_CHAGU|nr:hypothetical protein CgunFtcFv8_014936 [Champsocephalus gunnari]